MTKNSHKTGITNHTADIPNTSTTTLDKPLKRTADSYIAVAQSPATKRAYANDVRRFVNNGGSIPATSQQVMQYLADIADTLAVASIERYLIAIHKAHTDKGLPSPVDDAQVKRTMQGIRRTVGTRQRQVRAIVKDDILEMLVMVDKQMPFRAARDKALLLIGFAGAFRRSELVSLQCADITELDNGIEILLRHSKTDQEMAGRTVFIPLATGMRCPCRALNDWKTLTGIEQGYLFRAVNRHDQVSDKPLTAQSVALIVKAAVRSIGGDPAIVAGHSLRAGYVTTAAMIGLQPHVIRQPTGLPSDATLGKYIRIVSKRKTPSLL